MKRLKNLSFKTWLILGLFIRLILMPITFHPDILAINFAGYFFAFKKIFNIYNYLYYLSPDVPLVKNYGQNFFTYPPLSYFTFGLFTLLLKPFYNPHFFAFLTENLSEALKSSSLYFHLFLAKLPYLFVDLGVAFLLKELFEDKRKRRLAFILWLVNPLGLYTTFMIGQFDILPVFLVVLSLYFIKLGRPGWAAFSLGLGGSYKMFPLLFLPFLVLAVTRRFWPRIKLALLGLFPFVFTILPFLSSPAFRRFVLFSGQSQKMLFAKIPVSGAEGISVFLALFVALCVWTAYLGKKKDLWQDYLLVMLLFFSITHYHPQWFLWMTPFLLIGLLKKNFGYFWLQGGLFLCWLMIALLFEPSLNIGLFLPLRSTFSLAQILARFYDPFQFKTIVRSVFAGLSLGLGYLVFK